MMYHEEFAGLCRALEGAGAFLAVKDAKGRSNVMTIGWAQVGNIWARPVMTVLVRPSRYTNSLLAGAGGFTVSVPRPGELTKELAFCGSRSGRDYDKARACGLRLADGAAEGLVYVDGCRLVYHCRLAGSAPLDPSALPAETLKRFYPGGFGGEPHTLYFGEIIKAESFR
mgnify:CR=1 FL=1